jgi:uncharacterized LabA/DUF88 family protein
VIGLSHGKGVSFDFGKFTKLITKKNVKIIGKSYYVGRVRQDGSEKADKFVAGQQKLFQNLRKYGFKYVLGYLLKAGDVYHEKGVDVQIAVDMMEAAYEDLCDRIIIISSDTDLAPAIAKARAKGKIVEYVGFSHKPSVAMVSFCTESTLLKKEDLERLFKK